jgi:magnesium transporter
MQGLFKDELKRLLERVNDLIEAKDHGNLTKLVEDIHSADLIEILEALDEEQRVTLFNVLNTEEAADVLGDIDSDLFSEILEALSASRTKEILEEMAHDDIADHLGSLEDDRIKEIMAFMDKEDADDIRELLVYDEDTAGGLMTSEFISLDENLMVSEALEYLRYHAPDAETIYYLFVIDAYEKLAGVLSLRDLIVGKVDEPIKNLMSTRVISVNASDDQESVARVVSKYDFLAIPVIDDFDHMIGIITVDDIIDILEDEATEDMFKFAGASESEADFFEESIPKRIVASIKSRLPWLIVTLFGGMLSASIISGHESTLSGNAKLAIFIPILAGMGGNVGTQSSTITVRNIAVSDIKGFDVFKTILHEMSVGLLVGFFCSSIALAASYFIYDISPVMALVVGLAMWANILTAATIGTLVPLTFKKIGVDPAVASAPFITMTIDITGLTIYFALVIALLGRMV